MRLLSLLSCLILGTLTANTPPRDILYSGSIMVSESSYINGTFEFTFQPSYTPGAVTVFGFAKDRGEPTNQFFQVVFDPKLGQQYIQIQVGGLISNWTRTFNFSPSDIGLSGISSFAAQPLKYRIMRTYETAKLHIAKPGTQDYKLVFCTLEYAGMNDDQDLLNWLSVFPKITNVHLGMWFDSTTNKSAQADIYQTTFSNFQRGNADTFAVVENSLPSFKALSTTTPPMWARVGSVGSTFLASTVQSSNGQITLRVVKNVLPLDSTRWYTQPPQNLISASLPSGKPGMNVQFSLSNINTTQSALVLADLEVTGNQDRYAFSFCGSYRNLVGSNMLDLDGHNFNKWPILIYLRQTNYPYQVISSVAKSFISSSERCYEISSLYVYLDDVQVMDKELRNFATLVIDFSPILTVPSIKSLGFTSAAATITSIQASQSSVLYGDTSSPSLIQLPTTANLQSVTYMKPTSETHTTSTKKVTQQGNTIRIESYSFALLVSTLIITGMLFVLMKFLARKHHVDQLQNEISALNRKIILQEAQLTNNAQSRRVLKTDLGSGIDKHNQDVIVEFQHEDHKDQNETQ